MLEQVQSGARLFGEVADQLIKITTGEAQGPIFVDALVVAVVSVNHMNRTVRLSVEWRFEKKPVVKVCEVDVDIGGSATLMGLAETLTFKISC